MKRGARKGWRWRAPERTANKDLRLLYEPGNWGDILKGLWAISAARAIIEIEARGQKELHYFDPFAGAPTYPLVEASRHRLEAVPSPWLKSLQEPYSARGLMASTAVLVRDAARSLGAATRLTVFDLDPERKEAWKGEPGAQVLDLESGEAAMEALRGLAERPEPPDRVPDLVLVDPYDLFNHWERLLPAALSFARRSSVLLYSYNKAPRGAGQWRRYQDFRQAIATGLSPGCGSLLGRIPADPSLARAYHEVVLIGPEEALRGAREGLREGTAALARHMAEAGCFEALRGDSPQPLTSPALPAPGFPSSPPTSSP
jgi:hypothetical protein